MCRLCNEPDEVFDFCVCTTCGSPVCFDAKEDDLELKKPCAEWDKYLICENCAESREERNVVYEQINGIDGMRQLAGEMIRYANENPIYFEDVLKEAKAKGAVSPDGSIQFTGERFETVEKYSRFVRFDESETRLQLIYTKTIFDEGQQAYQFSMTDNFRNELSEEDIAYISPYFLDKELQTFKAKGLPPHVLALMQKIC